MYYLAIQTTYHELQLGLFFNGKLIDKIFDDKKESSKLIITRIDELLKHNNVKLNQIEFVAVNQGPAPFTALRVVIATANGISFASQLPLVGVDGLKAFLAEYSDPSWPITVALLNAFNNDVYYALQAPGQELKTGYENNELFLNGLLEQFPQKTIRFLGEGTHLFHTSIKNTFHENASIPDLLPLYPSIEQIGSIGFEQWNKKKQISNQLLPLYLKTLLYKKSISV